VSIVRILEAITLAALTVLLCKIVLFLNVLEPKLLVTVENTDRAMIAAGAAAGNVEKASRVWQSASASEIAQASLVASSVNAAVKRFTTFISKADESFNSSLVPAATLMIEQQNAALLTSQRELQTDIIASQRLLADADKQISNPSISASLANIDAVTLESAQTMQNVHSETDIILAQTKAAFAPEAKWKSIAKMVFNGTLNGAELFYYLTK
jgi:hypothetical protein